MKHSGFFSWFESKKQNTFLRIHIRPRKNVFLCRREVDSFSFDNWLEDMSTKDQVKTENL